MGFGSSGGGSNGSIAGSSDVALTSVSADQVLAYNTTASKWQNKTMTSATAITSVTGNVVMYSTNPSVRGTSDTSKVVIFITPTQPTVMVNNDIWLSQLSI
jgi:hypothetical protein